MFPYNIFEISSSVALESLFGVKKSGSSSNNCARWSATLSYSNPFVGQNQKFSESMINT